MGVLLAALVQARLQLLRQTLRVLAALVLRHTEQHRGGVRGWGEGEGGGGCGGGGCGGGGGACV